MSESRLKTIGWITIRVATGALACFIVVGVVIAAIALLITRRDALQVQANSTLGLRAAIRLMSADTGGTALPAPVDDEPTRFLRVSAANGDFILVWPPMRWHWESRSESTWAIDVDCSCHLPGGCEWAVVPVFESELPMRAWPDVPFDANQISWANVTIECRNPAALGYTGFWSSSSSDLLLDPTYQ